MGAPNTIQNSNFAVAGQFGFQALKGNKSQKSSSTSSQPHSVGPAVVATINKPAKPVQVESTMMVDTAGKIINPLNDLEMKAVVWLVEHTPKWLKDRIPSEIREAVKAWFGIKQTLEKTEEVAKNGTLEQKQQLLKQMGISNVESMPEEQINVTLGKIREALRVAVQANNIGAFIKAKDLLSVVLVNLSQAKDISPKTRVQADLTVKEEARGTLHFDRALAKEAKEAKTPEQIKAVAGNTVALHRSDKLIVAAAKQVGVTPEAVVAVIDNIRTGAAVAQIVINEAAAKGVILDSNINAGLLAMSKGVSTAISDLNSESVQGEPLRSFNETYDKAYRSVINNYMKEVTDEIIENRIEQNEEDERVGKQVADKNLLSQHKEQARAQEQGFTKIKYLRVLEKNLYLAKLEGDQEKVQKLAADIRSIQQTQTA